MPRNQRTRRSRRNLGTFLALGAVLSPLSLWIASCSVNVGLGPGAVQVGVGILGKTFTLTLGDVGAIAFEANIGVTIPTAFTLFDRNPPEPAASGRMILPTSSVGVGQRLSGKIAAQAQSLPLNGSATLTFTIATGHSATLCDSAILLSEYDIALTAGSVAVLDETYELSREALEIIATNDVTICIAVSADFDGELTLDDFMLTFDDPAKPHAGDDDPDTGDDDPTANQAQLALIPIANRNGRAVRTSVNRTIAGINYGVVGVLEDATAAVTVPTTSPNTLTLDPAELGLAAVSELHMGVHSSFVPDVAEGVTIATFVAEYFQGGPPTAVDFVLGSNTAEWSYTRNEHAAFGGVPHGQPSVLYSFKTTVDSSAEYTGFVYSFSLPVDPFRTLSRLTLTINSPEEFPPARITTGGLSLWAAQAITAITLEGWQLPVSEPVVEEACCTDSGACQNRLPGPCQDEGGIAQGPGTDCEQDVITCPTDDDPDPPPPPDDDPTGACCFVDGDCEDQTEESCLFVLGDYQGDGTSCDTVTCTAQIEYVVWYTGNVCCWGAPLLYITDRVTFNQPRLRSSFPGGGISPTEPAIKVEMQGGFASREDAQAWVCPRFTSSSFHFWCGRHYQMDGVNWQPGGLGCDFSSLPDNPDPPGLPEADVCSDVADSMLDIVACCYPNTTCAEVERPDCLAGGGSPHPGGHTRCGIEVCPGSPPPCPRDDVCDLDCPSFDGDPDCDFCDPDGQCITGCATPDQDCCLGVEVITNGDAESGSASQGFLDIMLLTEREHGWTSVIGNATTVAYAIGGPIHLTPAVSQRIGGGRNYFAGGRAGISPAIAQQNIFLNEHAPIDVIEEGVVRATLSADIGGFVTQPDNARVIVIFRDELLNDVGTMTIGPVTNIDRGNISMLHRRCTSALVPREAVTAEVRLSMHRWIGPYNDGYIDNVSLVLEHLDCIEDDAPQCPE